MVSLVASPLFVSSLLLLSFLLGSTESAYRPVVLWHGMGDSCCNPLSMGHIKKLLEEHLPGVYVYSIEVGDNVIDDSWNSYFMNVNEQIEYVYHKLQNNTNLSKGFNAYGFSQGGQFLRAYIQRFNNPPVYNLISVGGQHQGVYGLPKCLGNDSKICNIVRDMLNKGAYSDDVQPYLAQAEYWHDPLNLEEYLDKCIFMPDINNALTTQNETYKENFISLNRLALVQFTEDTVVQPRESEWFGFYIDGQDKLVQDVQNTSLYLNDTVGLKHLMDNDKVDFIPCKGDHLQFTDAWFITNLIPYANNTL
jgi:palmitoyl-protein thioesterase